MSFDFDQLIDRSGSASVKYDLRQKLFGREDVIPLWVADMDFATPSCVMEALKQRLEHPVLGYSHAMDSLYESILTWQKQQHGWEIQPGWIQMVPGVVPALGFAICALSEPGDGVVVQTPVYFPFYEVIEKNGRLIQRNPLKEETGRYGMDLENLKSIINDKTKLLLLCSPHNPGGSVWREEELNGLLELCASRGITLISDEIHADLTYAYARHIPIASLAKRYGTKVLTVSSAGKAFNIPGLNTAYVICEDDSLRRRFYHTLRSFHLDGANLLGMVATQAAYQEGKPWLESLLHYLAETMQQVRDMLDASSVPIITALPEATYLMWLDCRKLGMDDPNLQRHFVEKAGVGLSPGVQFGEEGSGHMRLNVAAPRSIVLKGMEQVISSFNT